MVVSKLATKYMFENFGAVRWNSRGGTPITTIVVHHAATTNFDIMPGVWKDREASAHYGIGPDGTIRAYVDEEKRAWHCGDGNSNSIGIECTNISGDPTWKVSEKTIDSLVQLIQEIQCRRGRLIIIGHKDVQGNATACPGPFLYPRLQEIRNRANKTTITTVKPSSAPQKTGWAREYNETGTMYATEANWIKRTPTKAAAIMEWQSIGQPIKYHKVLWNDGIIWLQLNYGGGGQAYVAYADANGTGFGRKYGYCK